MLIGIFMALLIVFSGGSPSFLIPKMDNYVKKYVAEEERKQKLLVLLKDAKAERKEFAKKNEKQHKELNKLLVSRNTTKEEFDDFIVKMNELRKKLQETNQKVIYEAQNYITEKEWDNMKTDIKKDFGKLNKKLNKAITKVEKTFDKMAVKLEQTIQDKSKSEKALKSTESFEKILLSHIREYQAEMTNENSLLYEYKVEESEIIASQQAFNKKMNELIRAYIDMHFELVNSTTEEEWALIKHKVEVKL